MVGRAVSVTKNHMTFGTLSYPSWAGCRDGGPAAEWAGCSQHWEGLATRDYSVQSGAHKRKERVTTEVFPRTKNVLGSDIQNPIINSIKRG